MCARDPCSPSVDDEVWGKNHDRRSRLPRRQKGAHTGDVSADMLKDAGAKWVIVGHSERRAEVKRGGHGETSKLVREKVLAAQMAGLRSIVCVGETLAERKSGDTLKVVGAQLRQSLPDTCSAETLSLLMSLSGPSVPA